MSTLDRINRARALSSDPANPSAEVLHELLSGARTAAVVGLSRDPMKAARRVPSYMAAKGFELVPVNPNAQSILGRPAHASLSDVSAPVDLVVVFRPSEEAGDVVRQAAARSERPAIWLQEGIRNDEAATPARESGLTVVQDLCLFKVHREL